MALASISCNDSESGHATAPLSEDFATVLAQVAEVRGIDPPDGVEAGTVTRDNVREVLADTLTDADREQFARMTALYRLLGFMGQDDDYEDLYLDLASRALIGFYEPARDSLWLVAEDETLEFESLDATRRSAVAHEFVHALQDAKFDLTELLKRASGDLDWSLALSAVLEGDAVQHERLWAMEHIAGSSVGGTPVTGIAGGGIPAAIERELRWPYEGGLDWVSLAGMANGNALTNAVLGGERITTAEILHPELRARGWQQENVPIPDLSMIGGLGWERVGTGSFGEFRLRNLLLLHLGGLQAVEAAAGWSGDNYDVYHDGEASVAVLGVAFSNETEAAEFGVAVAAWLQATGADVRNEGQRATAVLNDGRIVIARPAVGSEFLLVFGSTLEIAQTAADMLEGG